MGTSLISQDRERVAEALAKAEAQRRIAEQTVAELASVAASLRPIEPEEIGSVVRWTKWRDGYLYASIKGGVNDDNNGVWYTTQDPRRPGGNKIIPLTWPELLNLIQERNWGTLEVLS